MDPENEQIQLDDITFDDVIAGDGVETIAIDDVDSNVEEQEQEVVAHEMIHQTQMRLGKLAYTDNSITWDGVEYPRRDGYIVYEGKYVEEGSKEFPWERIPWDK